MSHKQSLFGVHRFYTKGQALTILTNVSDFEDESTSESENEGDSSDSFEYAPEQHQVRTDSNIQAVMPKETKVFKAKEISKKGQKAAPKPVDNQSVTKHALLADQTATTSGEEHVASPPKKYLKYLKPKKYLKRAKKLHQNWLIIRVSQSMLYWLIKQPPHQVRNMLLHLQKYLKPKKYPAKKLHQKWLIIRVPQRPWHPIVIWM